MTTVSVIVTTRNEERRLRACLDSVRQQDLSRERTELIVVDNHSTDRTRDIAAQCGAKVVIKGPERSAQRNCGVKEAHGDFILYLDADMRLSPTVLGECVRRCEEDGLTALYIPERVLGSSFWTRVRDFERGFYNATPVDAVRFVRRDTFLTVHGFDESFNEGEDWDLDRRLREHGRVGIITSPLFHDESGFRLADYLKKKGRYTSRLDRYIGKWGAEDPIVRKQTGFFYRFIGVFTENGKFKRLLVHPGLTLGMYVLRFCVGVSYLTAKRRVR